MAPAAVQTKQAVSVRTTSAPARRAHSATAGPGTPSRSPSAMTFLPRSSMLWLLSCNGGPRRPPQAPARSGHHAVPARAPLRSRTSETPSEEQATLPGEHRARETSRGEPAERVAEVRDRRGDVPLCGRESRHAPCADEVVDAVAADQLLDDGQAGERPVV